MGTFTPATTYNPYAMLLPDARSTPDEAQRRAAGQLQFVLQANPVDVGGGYGTGWGGNRYEQLAHYRGILYIALRAYLAAVGACRVNLLRRTVKKSASGRGNYSRDDEYEPVGSGEHPLATVLEQPGGEDGSLGILDECAYLTLQHMLTGDAAAWAPHNADGKPVRFFALTGAGVTQAVPMGADPRYPKGAYRFSPYGASGLFAAGRLSSQATLPGEEVGFFRMPHPMARSLAMSPLQAGDREIDCLEAITRARWATFDKGVHVDKVFILPGAGEDEAALMQRKLEQNFGGATNAGRSLVMSGAAIDAKLDVKMLAPNVREMDYGASYDQAAGVVASLFGVPKELINFGLDSNYSKDWAAKQRFYDDALSPYCRNLSAFLTRVLARPWETRPGELKIEVEPQLPKNIETEEKRRDTGLQTGALDVNEWRVSGGFSPKPDGDVPLSVYVAKIQQQLAPPMPGAEGGAAPPPGDVPPAAPGDAEQPAEDTPEATQDAVANAALAALGVPAEGEEQAEGQEQVAPLAKAVYDEAKHARDRGKFSAKPGAAGRVGHPSAKPDDYARTGRVAPWGLGTSGGPKDFPGTEHLSEHAKSVPASTPTARKTLLSVKTWARMHADRHADKVAKHFGIPREKAHQLLLHAIVETAKLAAKHGSTRTTGTLNQGGLKLRVNINGKVAPGGVPKPSNPDAAGSRGAPVVAKALEPREFADPAPYGYCPECREPGVCCERRPNGDATCAAGHTYPRAGAKYASTHVTLTGAAARKLRALAAKVADADLGADGREADPHVTARYGLHVDSPAPVVEVVRGFGPVAVRLGRLNAFRGAEYDVIYAEVDSPDLHRLNAALGELPHTDTHSAYTPHATVAYVKAGLADKYLATLGAVDEAVTVDSLTFSTAKRARVDVPLAAVVKAASTPDFANGGALVQTGDALRRRKRVMREVLARRLKALEMQG